jgi:ribosome-associated translation inhibitor RaiA
MDELDFTIEFNGEGLGDQAETAMFIEAEDRLRELASGHNDLIGAAINVRQPSKQTETSFIYEVTVVVYARPEHIAATKKGADPMTVLNEALSALERQVREKRDKFREHWKQPGNSPVEQEITEIIAAETSEPFDDEDVTR